MLFQAAPARDPSKGSLSPLIIPDGAQGFCVGGLGSVSIYERHKFEDTESPSSKPTRKAISRRAMCLSPCLPQREMPPAPRAEATHHLQGSSCSRIAIEREKNQHLSMVPMGFSVASSSSTAFKRPRSRKESSSPRERPALAQEKSKNV